jgi:subtilisin family serine protease
MRRAILIAVAALLTAAAPAGAAGDPRRGEQWGLDMIESDAAHAVASGRGVTVAVIDSGVLASHPDLQGRLLAGRDFVDGDSTPQDGNGHGTHVTGIVASNTLNDLGVASVAPGASVLPVRVLGDDGSGSASDVAAGIDWAVDQGAQVINLSLGGEIPILGSDPGFEAAIDRALDRGVVVVAAAGNSGLPVCEQPSAGGRLLCVGSIDENGNRSFFSSFGGSRGIMAPGGSALLGRDILSTWNDGGYAELAGTSQAAPHVAGAAALVLERGLTGQAAVERLLATASDAGPPGPDGEYGAGIVNARRAVEGLGAAGGGGGGRGGGSGGGAAGSFTVRAQSIRAVLRRGLRVRCRPLAAGRCRALARRGRVRVARGSRRLAAGSSAIVVARATPAGRRLLRRRLRARRRLALRVAVTLPGAAPEAVRVTLRP